MTVRRNAKPGETVRYVGANIGYIPGVPMKDMDAEEWNALDADLRVLALGSGLYELGDPEDAAEVKAAAQDEAAEPAEGKANNKAEPAKSEQGKPTQGKDAKGGD